MRYVDLARQHLLLTAAACGAVAGIVIGLFLPIHAAATGRGDVLQWRLPSPQSIRRFEQAQYESLTRAGFWDLRAPQRGAGRTSDGNGWTLKAIMTKPIAQVSVGTPGKAAQTWVRLGGKLPDGATLAAITRDAVWFELDGCRRMKRLYATGSTGGAAAANGGEEACIGQASPAPGNPPPRPPASNAKPAPPGAILSNGK